MVWRNKMNILVLFSYGSLYSVDDVGVFYDDILQGRATEEGKTALTEKYEAFGLPDPLGSNYQRIGRALIDQLAKEIDEEWELHIASHHALPSIQMVAEECAAKNPKRVLTFTVTPFDSSSGNSAYEKEFAKHFLPKDKNTELIHVPPYSAHKPFVEVLTDRVRTARNWLTESVREDAEIIFTVHSRPGTPEDHQQMITQYNELAKNIADSLEIKSYHLAYRSGNPNRPWLRPDVLDVIEKRAQADVPAIIFVEALSVIENMEVIQEITEEAVNKAQQLGMKAVQSEYLNDSFDFVDALFSHVLKISNLLAKN